MHHTLLSIAWSQFSKRSTNLVICQANSWSGPIPMQCAAEVHKSPSTSSCGHFGKECGDIGLREARYVPESSHLGKIEKVYSKSSLCILVVVEKYARWTLGELPTAHSTFDNRHSPTPKIANYLKSLLKSSMRLSTWVFERPTMWARQYTCRSLHDSNNDESRSRSSNQVGRHLCQWRWLKQASTHQPRNWRA